MNIPAMPDFLKDAQDVIFVTAADAFKEAIDAYKRGEFRETRGPAHSGALKDSVREEPVAADASKPSSGD